LEVKIYGVVANVARTEPIIEPVDPKNQNRTGTEKKPEKNRIKKPVSKNT
jgi:hypothetical protein